MTIDDLALMIQREFHEMRRTMATKDMLKDMVTRDMLQIVVDDIELIRADIRDIKITLGPLVRMVAALDTDVQHLMTRVARLEQKAGFVK